MTWRVFLCFKGIWLGLTLANPTFTGSMFEPKNSQSICHLKGIRLIQNNSYFRAICLVFGMSVIFAQSALADIVNRQAITVAYLYNFAKNVEWPQNAINDVFHIGVYGEVSPALRESLSQLEENNRLRGRPIQVRYINNVEAIKSVHMLYIVNINLLGINDFYQQVDGKPILLVTEESLDQSLVMINLLIKGNKVRFEVNKSNIINQGLLPLPELILNGGSEIDVAELYRQGQNSLVKLQKNLNQRESQLLSLEQKNAEQELLNKNLQMDMKGLLKEIAVSEGQVKAQNTVIAQQQAEIAKFGEEKNVLLAEIQSRTQELETQKQLLKDVTDKIVQGETRVKELDQIIKNQELKLTQKDMAISDLDQTVVAQRRTLFFTGTLVVLGVLLVIAVSVAYIDKQRANRKLAERAQDLQFAKDRLTIAKRKADEASQAKGEFLSLMSHELRTPLQSIIGYTELVLEELTQEGENPHLTDLGRVITNSERLLRLINNVLDMAKAEAGQMKLDLTPVKLSELAEDAIGNVKPIADKKGLTLIMDIHDGEYLAVADPEKILVIMINLMGNAVKFTSKGSISLRAVHLPNKIELSVKDSGPGISDDQLEKIFQAFHQTDLTRARKIEGTGLGLAITKQLVELMSGSINVKSELGKGAEFIVQIPLPIQETSDGKA